VIDLADGLIAGAVHVGVLNILARNEPVIWMGCCFSHGDFLRLNVVISTGCD
jgi:hypothetical protein